MPPKATNKKPFCSLRPPRFPSADCVFLVASSRSPFLSEEIQASGTKYNLQRNGLHIIFIQERFI